MLTGTASKFKFESANFAGVLFFSLDTHLNLIMIICAYIGLR